MLENNNYDIIFHLEPVIKPVDNGIRPKLHFEPDWRREKNDLVKSVLKMFPPKQTFYVETEDFEERIDFCIDKFQKFLG